MKNEGSNAEPRADAPDHAWWSPPEDAVPARMKARPEDFRVEECPPELDPEADDAGEHLVVWVEKRGRASDEVARSLGQAFGLAPDAVGYCGRKDVQAVTGQRFSLRGVPAEALAEHASDSLQLTPVGRRRKRLEMGEHSGNRFRIRLREVPADGPERLARGLARLAERGLANAFGEQRFGARGDNGRVGLALLAGRWREALERLCGRPGSLDFGDVLLARQAFAAGDWETCARSWPRAYGEQAFLVRRFAELGADDRAAQGSLAAMRKGTQRFYLNAAQSQLFNELLTERVRRRQRWLSGDVLEVAGELRPFEAIADAELRVADGSATPALPLFGRRDPVRAVGEARDAEDAALARHELDRRGFGRSGRVSLAGSRRIVRVFVKGAACSSGEDAHGPFVQLDFELPPGAYATQVIGELCQDHLRLGPDDIAAPAEPS